MKSARQQKVYQKGIYFLLILLFFHAGFLVAQEQPVTLKTASGEISGSLLIPLTKSKIPVVLLISGSGPTDRDGNQPSEENNSLKFLAQELSKNGIASLRFDKRGIGASMSAVEDEASLRFDNYISDVSDWIQLLSTDQRFTKIIVAGHSEGSLLGMIASANTKLVKAYISIAGAGRPADEILKEQLSTIHQPVKDILYPMIDSLKKGDTIPNVPVFFYSLFRPAIQPYMISWFSYDPQVEIKKLRIPVLILQGTTDIQVKALDAELLHKALPASELKIITNMNHVLKECDTTDKKLQEPIYADPGLPLNKDFVTAVIAFIEKLN